MDGPGYPTRSPFAVSLALICCLALSLGSCTRGNSGRSPTASADVLPTDTLSLLPDLVVQDVRLLRALPGECPSAVEPYRFGVIIQNQGESTAVPFHVQLNNSQQTVSPGLLPGQVLTLPFSGFDLTVDIRVDPDGRVIESDETNNQLVQEFSTPTLSAECQVTPTPAVEHARPQVTLQGHASKVWAVAFSPDGNLLASGSVDNTLRLWRVREGTLLRTMVGHPFPVVSIAFSKDGATLATGSTDGIIRLWRVSNGQLTKNLEGHVGWVSSLSYSPDGKFLASSAQDFTVRVWRNADGKLVQTIDEGMALVNSVAFSPDSTLLAWGEDDGTVRVRTLSGIWLHIFKESTLGVTRIAFSPDGDILAAGYEDGTLRFWRLSDVELIQVVKIHALAISGLAFSPDGSWLVAGSKDGTLSLWKIVSGEVQSTPSLIYTGHEGAVNDTAFSPQGTLIASGGDDATVRLWAVPQQ